MANAQSNIQGTTRELWSRTLEAEIFLRLPLLRMLEEWKRKEVSGTAMRQSFTTGTLQDLGQSYNASDVLTAGEKTVIDYAQWGWKKFQVPVMYDVDVEIQNQGADTATAPIDIVKTLTQQGIDGSRRKLMTMVYGDLPVAITTAGLEGGTDFQGLIAALRHNATYGTLTRNGSVATPTVNGATIAAGVNTFWESASRTGTYVAATDQDLACSPSVSLIRTMALKCRRHRPQDEKLVCVLGEANWSAVKAEVGAAVRYNGDNLNKNLYKYGFQSFDIDGNIEVLLDQTLDTATDAISAGGLGMAATMGNSSSTALKNFMFLLNPMTWQLRISPKRDMKMTPFVHQAQYLNGRDVYLAHVLAAGNLFCTQPNANAMLTNVA